MNRDHARGYGRARSSFHFERKAGEPTTHYLPGGNKMKESKLSDAIDTLAQQEEYGSE